MASPLEEIPWNARGSIGQENFEMTRLLPGQVGLGTLGARLGFSSLALWVKVERSPWRTSLQTLRSNRVVAICLRHGNGSLSSLQLETNRRRGFNWNCRVRTCGADASCWLPRRGPFVVACVSRRRFAREPLQSDDDDHLFNPLLPVTSSPSALLPASFSEKGHR